MKLSSEGKHELLRAAFHASRAAARLIDSAEQISPDESEIEDIRNVLRSALGATHAAQAERD